MKRNPTSPKTSRKPDPWLVRIATEVLQFPTLETRGRDSLDFKEVAVWNVKQALDGAYRRGFIKGGGMLSGPSIHTFTDPVAVAAIAKKFFNFPTLETHRVGDLDFKEVAVWNVMPALEDAHRAGFAAARGKKRNPRTPFSNSPPPASSNWSGFARAADVGELDLDAIADATGYGGWYNLDRSISPSTIANERNTPSGSVRFTKFAKAIRAHSLKLSKASADRIARALLAERPYKRNPTTAYHRARGDAQLVLAEDAYKKAKAMSRRGDAKGAHDSLIHAHRMAALAESDLTDGASTKAAKAKSLTWWKAYSQLAQSPKRNPAKGYKMPEAQARHTAEGLLTRMKADGADTFAKKVKWVKKHMPNIDRPRTFVGWVTKGERGRVVYQRNPDASYAERVKAAEDARAKLFRSLKGKTKEDLIRILGGYYRIHGLTTKSSITDLKYAITSAAYPDPRPPRSR